MYHGYMSNIRYYDLSQPNDVQVMQGKSDIQLNSALSDLPGN